MNIPLINLKLQYRKVEKGLLPKLKEILSEQRLILGRYCTELEESIARYSGVPHALSCANGTDALILALMALGIKRDDEVITTPYTFFSTASSIVLLGAKPVFVDVKREDMNINPDLIERAITPKTKAITVVHLFGKLCDMEAVSRIAGKHGLPVVEDMAQSLGARRNGVASGAFGDIAAVSFYPTKNLGGIGEGGMVLTRRDDLFERAKKLRVHGMGQDVYHHEIIGFNSRLDEIKACALVEKFPRLEEWNRKRIENAMFYNRKLRDLPIILPETDGRGDHIFHQYVIRIEKRDQLKTFLQQKGVATGIYYPLPLHLQDCFAYLGYKKGDCREAENASLTSLALPVFPELKKAEKDYVIRSIREFFEDQ
ncbi:MAG: UDP-2-acetamido-2-deoxy-3-oxo-D-glucuronate aminotransferase [Syntrophorhabdaceae bacterium PtaU1.Bin034]|jgi:dTDP-4-amino-4,6-dideoxygalactose transaminase|nr:MAG: UDP-2-acetamido-2-deoxy-3-oxo-D-glucuronate aminotransferase [Syntrophorhabdaceae bacterium PtaU1.Bin034]